MQRLIIIFLFLIYGPTSFAEEIRVGMSAPLTGDLKQIGLDMKNGIESYFRGINVNGGINGRTFRLIVKDDASEPQRAAKNVRSLIAEDNVIAFIGNVGTPTAVVTLPITIENKILFFGALSGAAVLRQKEDSRYVKNFRASYAEEAEAMISGLLSAGINLEEIAFFTQQDSYGLEGYNGAIQALKKHGFLKTGILVHGQYERNTLNVESAVASIINSEIEPKAIIMAGSYKPSAKFIKLVKNIFPDMLFLIYSSVGSSTLKQELGNNTDGVIVTEVVPSISPQLTAGAEYLRDFWVFKHEKPTGLVSFEGYLVAKLFVESIKRQTGEINAETIIDCLEKLESVDIGIGINISYIDGSNQALHHIWPKIIIDNKFVPLDWNSLNDYF